MAPNSFTSGALCLDLANTLEGPRGGATYDRIRGYDDLVAWGEEAGILGGAEARRLRREGERRPTAARAALVRAQALRETVYRIFASVAADRGPSLEDLEALNTEVGRAMAHARVARRPTGYAWSWESDPDALDAMLWPVVRSAAELLVAEDRELLKECSGESCSRLFLDATRRRARRWCGPRVCQSRRRRSRRRSAAR
jgi:predicted RNA-binding Zn ribbon-like protein